jgi:hypothetical protein
MDRVYACVGGGDVLDDAQIAAVSNWLRGSWGNSSAAYCHLFLRLS